MLAEKILKEMQNFENVKAYDTTINLYMFEALERIKKECENEIRAKENKKNGTGKMETFVKKLVKAAINFQGDNTLMRYGKTLYSEYDGQTYQYFIDGHRILRLKNRITWEECPECEKFFDVEKMFNEYNNIYKEYVFKESARDIIAAYKIAKADTDKNRNLVYSFGTFTDNNGESYQYIINAEYMVDFLKVAGIETYRKNNGRYTPIFLENKNNDVCLVLPVKPTAGKEYAQGIHDLTTGKYYG